MNDAKNVPGDRLAPIKRAVDPMMMALNLMGVFFYLKNASLAWANSGEVGLDPAVWGATIVWCLGAVHLLFEFILIDLAWISIGRHSRTKLINVATSLVVWLGALLYDFGHS